MCDSQPALTHGSEGPGRRRFLTAAILAIHGAIGATLSVVLGGSVLAPALARRQASWRLAGALSHLTDEEPTSVIIRLARQDGYARTVERKIVFLVKTGDGQVTALSSVCPHLGCRVSWQPDEQAFLCPCHGGAFHSSGAVKAGPPPGPLAAFATKIEGDRILVQL
jgi:Rieske Fe-S protein